MEWLNVESLFKIFRKTGKAGRRSIPKLSLVNDVCLMESLMFLTRDDIDQLPMVGRRFRRLLSHAYFQSAPLRLFDLYDQLSRFPAYFCVPASILKRYPRFFAPLEKRLEPVTFGENKDMWGFLYDLEGLIALLDQCPWLRCKRTCLRIENEEDVTQLARLRRLWEGGGLEINMWATGSRPNCTSLVAGCRSLYIGRYLDKLSLADWDMTACNKLTVSQRANRLQLEQLINAFLIPGGDGETEKRLELWDFYFVTADFTLDELLEWIKKRFLCVHQPNRFELELKAWIDANTPEGENIEVVEHPNGTNTSLRQCRIKVKVKNGKCWVNVQYPWND